MWDVSPSLLPWNTFQQDAGTQGLEVETEGHGTTTGGVCTQVPKALKSELEACSLCWMGLACLGKGVPLSWEGLGGTDIRLKFVFKGLELATLELDCSDTDLSPSKRGPILSW